MMTCFILFNHANSEKGNTGEKGDPGERGQTGERGEKGEPGQKGEPASKKLLAFYVGMLLNFITPNRQFVNKQPLDTLFIYFSFNKIHFCCNNTWKTRCYAVHR